MRIQNNIAALNTHRNYGINNAALAKSTEKLSSGYRINRAGDDAAGLAVSEKMRAQIRGLEISSRNAQDGVSLVQTAEGYLQDVQDILHRMKDVANQLANGIYDTADYDNAQIEFNELMEEIDYILTNAEFNGVGLFTDTVGTAGTPTGPDDIKITLQVGYKSDDTMDMEWGAQTTDSLGIDPTNSVKISDLSVADQVEANKALDTLYDAIDAVSGLRAQIGAYQNRLEFKISSIDNAAENLTAAESRIRDVDMAKEMTEYTKQNILAQAATAMLAQANSQPQLVLQLLG